VTRALVLGGTGHVGAAVVHEALTRGFAVSVASRSEALPRSLAGLAVDHLRFDIGDRAALRRAIEGHALVVDAAAPYPLHAGADVEAEAVARTRAVIRAVADAGATLAFVSSFVTLPSPGRLRSRMIRAAHPYFAVKQAMEDEVSRAARAGLRAVVVNPTACLGPFDDKPIELSIIPLLLAGKLAATVSSPINVVDVRDVARGLLEAVAQERYAEPIPLSGHNLGADELARRVCALAKVPAPIVRVPIGPTVLGALWLDAAYASVGRESPYPALSVLLIAESEPREVAAIQRELGAAPRELDETLRDAIAWSRGAHSSSSSSSSSSPSSSSQ
jgi:dihydroflavonol-4-reductase